MNKKSFLVVAPPRSGFTLLISILSILYRDRGMTKPFAQTIADPYISKAGFYLDSSIRTFFLSRYGNEQLFYNKEFSIIVGGPKWYMPHDNDTICVRKYLGIKGEGDFTFLLYLPKWVLAFDEIIHSHSHPARWPSMRDYVGFRKFASIRNPIDIIHSSVFSINALASEYIEREIKLDEHHIRRELALNKLTNPEFITGLIAFLKKYLDEFIQVKDQYNYVMRWEDLISYPVNEIQRIAYATGEPVTQQYATDVWRELDHRNLTRYHRHSFRRGLLNDWQYNISNTHLKLFKEAGFDYYLNIFGYEPITFFDEKNYTLDQCLIEKYINNSEVYKENLDDDLIKFAFNKTNFTPSSSYKFKQYPRQGAIEIERSSLVSDNLARDFMQYMAPITENIYQFLKDLELAASFASLGDNSILNELKIKYCDIFSNTIEENNSSMQADIILDNNLSFSPRLLGERSGYNIVFYLECYYCVPQSLGPMDFSQLDLLALPDKVLIASSYDEAIKAIKTQ